MNGKDIQTEQATEEQIESFNFFIIVFDKDYKAKEIIGFENYPSIDYVSSTLVGVTNKYKEDIKNLYIDIINKETYETMKK